MFEILIVEDDQAICDMLESFLLTKNYTVKTAKSGEVCFEVLSEKIPDLMLLDWMLPDTSGPDIIKRIRNNDVQKHIPVLMLTARAEEADKIKGLDVGADDYMTKPVSLKELDARIKALLRRSQGLNVDTTITRGSVTINLDNNSLMVNDERVDIGQTEFRLLYFFMRTPERIVDVHILRLRKVLKQYQCENMIKTVRGVGYRFTEKAIDS